MADIIVRTDIKLLGLDNMLKAAGPRADIAISRGINRAGLPVANAGKRYIRKALGLRQHPYAKGTPRLAINRNTSIKKATASSLTFSLSGFGQGFPAIYYMPREGRSGATINWLGARKQIARSFYLGGQFPRRKRSKISHVVWQRTGHGKWSLSRPRGPGVPEAMATPGMRSSWESQAAARLPHHLRAALEAVLRGY
jgi:hypothetical protein